MNQSEFILLVEQMRNAQKEYFKTRDRMVLLKSKELEKKVDEQIAVIKRKSSQADTVSVIRCKDCKHWNPKGIGICKLHDIRPTPLMMDNWFCADGKAKV